MMQIVALHDKAELAAALKRDPYRNAYALGDLDDFFWPYTQWYGLKNDAGELQEVALLYMAPGLPVLQAISTAESAMMNELVAGIQRFLPRTCYAHFTLDLFDTVKAAYPHVEEHGVYAKMALKHPHLLETVDTGAASQLGVQDRAALEALYASSYPGNWFDARMLETGQYFGVWRDGCLVSVAGIHVYSPSYKVASLGNITTHPDYRGQGLATLTTGALCKALLKNVTHISLNVHHENASAIRCYERLGFERITLYGEYTISG